LKSDFFCYSGLRSAINNVTAVQYRVQRGNDYHSNIAQIFKYILCIFLEISLCAALSLYAVTDLERYDVLNVLKIGTPETRRTCLHPHRRAMSQMAIYAE